MNSQNSPQDDFQRVKVKVAVLQNEYNQVRTHVESMDQQSLRISTLAILALFTVSEALETTPVFAAFLPLFLACIVSVVMYLRMTSTHYSGMCRKIEHHINSLVDDQTLLLFERDRCKMDEDFNLPWGPGFVTYRLAGLLFVAVFTYFSIRACLALGESFGTVLALVAGVVYTVMLSLVVLAIRKTFGTASVTFGRGAASDLRHSKRALPAQGTSDSGTAESHWGVWDVSITPAYSVRV